MTAISGVEENAARDDKAIARADKLGLCRKGCPGAASENEQRKAD
jgi:hypothetical protein